VDYGIYETSCADGRDNDGDGHTDCLDRDCVFGPECPSLATPLEVCGACADQNGNGVIFKDFSDLNTALSLTDYQRIYRCAQVYNPYCVDTGAPDPISSPNEAREFMDWMRDKNYSGRIIALHADALNDPTRREDGRDLDTDFQKYFDRRNEASTEGDLPFHHFKASGTMRVDFVEVMATDTGPDILNDINTSFEVETFFVPYFEDQIFGREMQVNYVSLDLSYVTEFGPYADCVPPKPNTVCFDPNAVNSRLSQIFHDTQNYENFAGNLSADKLADATATKISLGRTFFLQTVWHQRTVVPMLANLGGGLTLSAHVWGHSVRLNHPIAQICHATDTPSSGLSFCTDLEPYNPAADVGRLLGTCGIMSLGGYIYGCAERLEPLYRYALEPGDGYKDDATFGPAYSEETLGGCDAPPLSPTVFDNIDHVIDTRPQEFSTYFTDGPPIPGNGELSSITDGATFGEVFDPGLISVEELSNPAGIRATSSSADEVQLLMCSDTQTVTLSNDVRWDELNCDASLFAAADPSNTQHGSIQSGPPFSAQEPKIEALVPPGAAVTISRTNGWRVDAPGGVTVMVREISPGGPDEDDLVHVRVDQSPDSEVLYTPVGDVGSIEITAGTAVVIGKTSTIFLGEGDEIEVCASGDVAEPVAVCHQTKGKKGKGLTKHVACSSLTDHLAHGDSTGECSSAP
jgi:hypothetical protein